MKPYKHIILALFFILAIAGSKQSTAGTLFSNSLISQKQSKDSLYEKSVRNMNSYLYKMADSYDATLNQLSKLGGGEKLMQGELLSDGFSVILNPSFTKYYYFDANGNEVPESSPYAFYSEVNISIWLQSYGYINYSINYTLVDNKTLDILSRNRLVEYP